MNGVVFSQGNLPSGLFAAAESCLECRDPELKVALTAQAALIRSKGQLLPEQDTTLKPIGLPGRPLRPHLIDVRFLPQRKLNSAEGRAGLLHAIAHIEFNAINLAWDAVYRFRDMPARYYDDWIRVAADEARHFQLVCARLSELGYTYGDFDAHDGLWEMAVKTANSCLQRMALVPRVLEARGLDVTPGMMERFGAIGDQASVDLLRVILNEEVAHVAVGTYWYRWCCTQQELDPDSTFMKLVEGNMGVPLKTPINRAARLQAGFSVSELERLTQVPA